MTKVLFDAGVKNCTADLVEMYFTRVEGRGQDVGNQYLHNSCCQPPY